MMEVGVAGLFPRKSGSACWRPGPALPARIVGQLNHAVNEGLRSEEVRHQLRQSSASRSKNRDRARILPPAPYRNKYATGKSSVDATGIKNRVSLIASVILVAALIAEGLLRQPVASDHCERKFRIMGSKRRAPADASSPLSSGKKKRRVFAVPSFCTESGARRGR